MVHHTTRSQHNGSVSGCSLNTPTRHRRNFAQRVRARTAIVATRQHITTTIVNARVTRQAINRQTLHPNRTSPLRALNFISTRRTTLRFTNRHRHVSFGHTIFRTRRAIRPVFLGGLLYPTSQFRRRLIIVSSFRRTLKMIQLVNNLRGVRRFRRTILQQVSRRQHPPRQNMVNFLVMETRTKTTKRINLVRRRHLTQPTLNIRPSRINNTTRTITMSPNNRRVTGRPFIPHRHVSLVNKFNRRTFHPISTALIHHIINRQPISRPQNNQRNSTRTDLNINQITTRLFNRTIRSTLMTNMIQMVRIQLINRASMVHTFTARHTNNNRPNIRTNVTRNINTRVNLTLTTNRRHSIINCTGTLLVRLTRFILVFQLFLDSISGTMMTHQTYLRHVGRNGAQQQQRRMKRNSARIQHQPRRLIIRNRLNLTDILTRQLRLLQVLHRRVDHTIRPRHHFTTTTRPRTPSLFNHNRQRFGLVRLPVNTVQFRQRRRLRFITRPLHLRNTSTTVRLTNGRHTFSQHSFRVRLNTIVNFNTRVRLNQNRRHSHTIIIFSLMVTRTMTKGFRSVAHHTKRRQPTLLTTQFNHNSRTFTLRFTLTVRRVSPFFININLPHQHPASIRHIETVNLRMRATIASLTPTRQHHIQTRHRTRIRPTHRPRHRRPQRQFRTSFHYDVDDVNIVSLNEVVEIYRANAPLGQRCGADVTAIATE